jgi:CheY-like chemotaxis protein
MIEESLKLKSDRALNGKEAVKLVEDRMVRNEVEPCTCPRNRTNYKLIFMDCNMPIMDGFQATQEIRKHHLDSS